MSQRVWGNWCGGGNGFTSVEFKCPKCSEYVYFTVEEVFEETVERECACGQLIRAYPLSQPFALAVS